MFSGPDCIRDVAPRLFPQRVVARLPRLTPGRLGREIRRHDEAGDSKLSFDYPDGPVTPRQEKLADPRRVKAKRRSTPRRKPSGLRRNDTPPSGSSVPNVPLVKV